MPKPPRLSPKIIGPGIVLIAMGLGSGEFILWPNLVSRFGFGIIWGAIVGISLQFVVSNETGRYTLATGGSIYEGLSRVSKIIPFWFILSTFLSFAWPGIIGSAGTILGHQFGIEEHKWITVLLLLLIGLILTLGGNVYNSLEKVQKLVIIFSIPLLVIIAIIVTDINAIKSLFEGSFGKGEGYWFFPSGIELLGFLGAVAYAGAGGNLVASHSFYLQDEGSGNAVAKTQVNFRDSSKEIYRGNLPENSAGNIKNFRGWFRIAAIEQFFSFWFLGLLTIFLLVIISYSLLYRFSGEDNLDFLFLQSEVLSKDHFQILGDIFLIIGSAFLFSTQLGIFETTSRIMTENIQLMSETVRKSFTRSKIYFFFLWLQIFSAIIISIIEIDAPLQIILIGSFFSAVSMFGLSCLLLIFYRTKILPDDFKPGIIRQLMLLIAGVFFAILIGFTINESF